jgi:hypothetical protein
VCGRRSGSGRGEGAKWDAAAHQTRVYIVLIKMRNMYIRQKVTDGSVWSSRNGCISRIQEEKGK